MAVSQDGRFFELTADGGCFPGNDVGFYVRAVHDKLYKFDYVPVEVRSSYDPYVVWAGSGYTIEQQTPGVKPANNTNFVYLGILATLGFAILTFVTYSRAKANSKDGESKSLFK